MIPRRRGKTPIDRQKRKNSSSIEIFYDRSSDVTVVTSKRRRTVTISCPWTRVVCTESRGGKTEEPRERERERERDSGDAHVLSREQTRRERGWRVLSARQAARFEWRRGTRAAAWCSSTIGRRHHHQLIIRECGLHSATDSLRGVACAD